MKMIKTKTTSFHQNEMLPPHWKLWLQALPVQIDI